MAKIVTYLFEVLETGDLIRKNYQGHLAWFFDDHPNNPLSYPKGAYSIRGYGDDEAIAVDFDPTITSPDELRNYFLTLGITTGKAWERERKWYETPVMILLSPVWIFLALFAIIVVVIDKFKRKND